jgi:hypothetical protein
MLTDEDIRTADAILAKRCQVKLDPSDEWQELIKKRD